MHRPWQFPPCLPLLDGDQSPQVCHLLPPRTSPPCVTKQLTWATYLPNDRLSSGKNWSLEVRSLCRRIVNIEGTVSTSLCTKFSYLFNASHKEWTLPAACTQVDAAILGFDVVCDGCKQSVCWGAIQHSEYRSICFCSEELEDGQHTARTDVFAVQKAQSISCSQQMSVSGLPKRSWAWSWNGFWEVTKVNGRSKRKSMRQMVSLKRATVCLKEAWLQVCNKEQGKAVKTLIGSHVESTYRVPHPVDGPLAAPMTPEPVSKRDVVQIPHRLHATFWVYEGSDYRRCAERQRICCLYQAAHSAQSPIDSQQLVRNIWTICILGSSRRHCCLSKAW